MEITNSQKRVIESLICERLRINPENKDIVKSFCNSRNDGIAKTLREQAWDEDNEGGIAYYVVKSAEGQILFFFSLKCGGLHRSLSLEQDKMFGIIQKTLKKISSGRLLPDEMKMVTKLLGELQSKFRLSREQILQKLKYEQIEREYRLENKNVNRVGLTHSGIELVHFCANEGAKEYWKDFKMPHSLGTVVFWSKIVPLVLSVMEKIGCNYLFLFAADLSSDKKLVNYYSNRLKFETPDDLGTNKPIYDLSCKFMSKKTKNLKSEQDKFFEEFNMEML